MLGIGFWPTACGGDDAAAIARSIRYAVDVAGIEHVGLGSDFDGAVPVPFDATGLVVLTDALIDAGFADDDDRQGHGRQRSGGCWPTSSRSDGSRAGRRVR